LSFFESLVALLALAVILLQVSRRVAAPYPAMLAAAGVALALIPGAPQIKLDPHTALALFVAPILMDAGFDFPLGAVRRFWRPLVALAVIAVLLTTGAVAALGVAMVGLPLYAALALGAIVAPPDAAAATAVLSQVKMPRRSVIILKGESLLNDATALLLFGAATAVHARGALDAVLALQIVLAAPGGILLGIVLARAFRWVAPYVSGTLGGNLLEFISSFGVWIIAEHLKLSPILCLVAFAMTIARTAGALTPPRSRIHSFAVWDTAVFLLNVLAFLLMGLQARTIMASMSSERLVEAARFSGYVVACVILVRMGWLLIYNRIAARFYFARGAIEPATLSQGILVGWCGMRGLVTLATAFALPPDFPQRDLIVLSAFAVVLATLTFQGLTLAPLIRLLKLDGEIGLAAELMATRAEMARAALLRLELVRGAAADHWRYALETQCVAPASREAAPPPELPLETWRGVGLAAMRRQRERLEELRKSHQVGPDAFLILQEELDFTDVALGSDEQRRMEED
jgi:CPA1 family monovalent cation:H+ antiporter